MLCRPLLINKGILLQFLAACVSLLVIGCGSRSPAPLSDLTLSHRHPYPIDVKVISPDKENSAVPDEYRGALVQTIINSQAFSSIQEGADATLSVVLGPTRVSPGMTNEGSSHAVWTFVNAKGIKSTNTIIGRSSMSVGDTFLGAVRSRQVFRAAVEDSIRQGVTWATECPD
jgi:hypothetical protein